MGDKRSRGRPPHPDVLTPAEWGVVEAVRHGMSNRQIARRRGVSLDAVKQQVADARDKLGLADREALQDWEGVRMDSALKRNRAEPGAELRLGPIGQIARKVDDAAAAEAWYRDVLGLTHLYSFGKLVFFDCGGVRLYLDENGAEADSILYFRVPDIHAAQATLKARGVAFTGAPHMIHRHADGTEEWMAFFEDNEGRALALMSQVAPA
jgi:catechol 2,3-dioxygenase-like lactoylglutathione lyase family enzyme/DNA-binding CsgD family transcriptional regulator